MQTTYFLFAGALVLLHFIATSSASIIVANNHNNSASDLNALLAFKAAIFDPQRIISTNWSASTSVCNWIGITCNARHHRVAAIDLSYMGIAGTIPPQLGNLSFLVRLNVMNNSFHGHLPTELSRLRRLKYINLEGNNFEGELPSWLGALTALRFLSFRDNGFSGPLPQALFNLSSLQIIRFTNNSLSGYLPAHICDHLPQLQGLYLSLNNFEGEIPSGIGECSGLQFFSLSYNKFRGYIPKEFWNLTTLTLIALGGNDLTENSNAVQKVSNTYNAITGEIPKVIDNLYNLEILGMERANVTGIIPQEVGNLSKLEVFELDLNRLRGPIPLKLFNSSTVRVIALTENDLSGELPSTIGAFLPNLEELYLGGNEFTGTILTSISNASRLRMLDLDTNHFTGAIPHSLGNLRLLEQFDIWQNDFSEDSLSKELSFIISLSNCKHLTELWIDDNPLNGFIPKSIGNLSSSLESIIASNCGIISEIPSSIDVASGLEYLHYGYSTPIVHCDLKPSNILLDEDMVGHVCDFGIAKLLGDGESVVQTKTLATFGYIAPEYGLEGLVSTSCDVYSFGITLMETFTKRKPKDEMFTEELSLRRWVQDCLPDSVIQVIDVDLLHPEDGLVQTKINCISSVLQLGLSCTTDAPKERIDMKEVLRALQKIKLQFIKDITP
ncbi:unnamed protein product [Coffea canephora]|uniref:non-specific serine/threonine protein kinase n=1 Tax=Coffea canephora TaxID=49390 RepID=A0A068VII9_COFCA|nr:unnamed protein product [Coffea canephora]